MPDYRKQQKHLRDLNFLLNFRRPVDMSSQAVNERMKGLNEISELSFRLGIPDIYDFRDHIYIDPPQPSENRNDNN